MSARGYVRAGLTNCKYQVGLVGSRDIAAFGAKMDGGSCVCKNLRPSSKPNRTGLNVLVDAGETLGVKVHLCYDSGCKGGDKDRIHITDWCYAEEDAGDDALLSILAAGPVGTPPGLETFELSPPGKSKGPTDLATWLKHRDLEWFTDLLAGEEVCLDDLFGLHDDDLTAFFKENPQVPLGLRGRLRRALETAQSAQGQLADRPQGRAAPTTGPSGNPLGAAGPPFQGRVMGPLGHRGQSQGMEGRGNGAGWTAPDGSPGFGQAGPLEELAAGASRLLGLPHGGLNAGMGGLTAQGPGAGPPNQGQGGYPFQAVPQGTNQPFPPTYGFPGQGLPGGTSWPSQGQYSHPAQATMTAGGRLIMPTPTRGPAQPVPLRVQASHGAAIWEEWTDSGRKSLASAVQERTWKGTATKEAAYANARALDVMMASGIDVSREAGGEVALRNLAATWFGDQHPKEQEVANLLMESSLSTWGIPRGLWEEARNTRKLLRGAGSSD